MWKLRLCFCYVTCGCWALARWRRLVLLLVSLETKGSVTPGWRLTVTWSGTLFNDHTGWSSQCWNHSLRWRLKVRHRWHFPPDTIEKKKNNSENPIVSQSIRANQTLSQTQILSQPSLTHTKFPGKEEGECGRANGNNHLLSLKSSMSSFSNDRFALNYLLK